ncbi:TetR/AcrR family transcriptional regulator [Rathayibacter soli]|uniref:TetR/AcrR family transcriptional regulator n=1 Tax=Rathayibacter soli TaxID=3144168 RepID=UPI0027E493C0|nr:TetR/AcrR family transcriptional regulator [Glaciibacter superstes]
MATPSGPARRGQYSKTAARRQQILHAAHQVFAARGYHAGSLREVAGAAGISLSNLTHHFPTKEDLLLAVLELRDHGGALRQAQEPETADAAGFREHLLAQARANESIPGLIALYAVLSAESTTTEHPGREYFIGRFSSLREAYTREFEALRDAGRLREGVDPLIAASSLVALWDGIQLQWLLQPQTVDVAEHLATFLDLIILPPGP